MSSKFLVSFSNAQVAITGRIMRQGDCIFPKYLRLHDLFPDRVRAGLCHERGTYLPYQYPILIVVEAIYFKINSA